MIMTDGSDRLDLTELGTLSLNTSGEMIGGTSSSRGGET